MLIGRSDLLTFRSRKVPTDPSARPGVAWQSVIMLGIKIAEPLIIAVGGATAYWLTERSTALPTVYALVIGCGMLLSVIVFNSASAYTPSLIDNFWASSGRAVSLWVTVCMILVSGTFLSKPDVSISRGWAVTALLLVAGGLIALRGGVSYVVRRARHAGRLSTKVAIIGADDAGLALYQQLAKYPELVNLVGIYDDRMTRMQVKASDLNIQITGRVDDLLSDARKGHLDSVIINLPWTGERRLRDLIEVLRTLRVEVQLCPEGLGFVVRNFPLFRHSVATNLGGVPLFTVVTRPLDGWGWLIKRVEDVTLVLLAAPILLPLCLLIALAIKLDSRGSVFFRQRRSGFNGETFWVYKFRTMRQHAGAETGEVVSAERNDPRVTRVGRILRRTSLDEVPQLLNVLKGDMSIIGPRPHAVSHSAQFAQLIRQFYARHRVLPGLTGWAQVNGLRGSIEDPDTIKQRVDHDLYYIENWSLWFDLKILLLTPLALLSRNAY
jgi:Undecaprenyl-phosphate glucose phosphotransferase